MACHDVRMALCSYFYATMRENKKCMPTELIRTVQHPAQISVEQQLLFLKQTGSLFFETLLGLANYLLYTKNLQLCTTMRLLALQSQPDYVVIRIPGEPWAKMD